MESEAPVSRHTSSMGYPGAARRGTGDQRSSRRDTYDHQEAIAGPDTQRFQDRPRGTIGGRPPVLQKSLRYDGKTNWQAFHAKFSRLAQDGQRRAFLGEVNLSSSEPSQASSSSEQRNPPAKAGIFSRLGSPVGTPKSPRPRGLGSRSSPLSLGARGLSQKGDSSWSRGTESRLCRDLPDAFDSHMHLDRSLSKFGMPPRTSLGDFLRMRLTSAPVDPVKLAGGVAVFCDPKTWSSVPLRLEPGWVGAVGIHTKSARQFEDAIQHRFHQLVSHPSVSALGKVGMDFIAEEKLHARHSPNLYLKVDPPVLSF
ncbi:tatD [Mytilus coruscus]|uniref:TatD n=1 Tax=Mytilus coruscus TaxID=42192 RepID=A0A6J8CXB3_MYTCO|nr:tatD [Mytilus coruscus]